MQLRFALCLFLLSPLGAKADAIVSLYHVEPGCTGTQTVTGEQAAHASFFCPGANAGAGVNLFNLSLNANKVAGVPWAHASAGFDYQVMVVGTDQPGFLLIHPNYSASMRQD